MSELFSNENTDTKKVNEISQVSFTENHKLYDSVRPSFRAEAVDCLIKKLDLPEGRKPIVLDLAAGTGKFTRLLNLKGFNVKAVEPSPGMLSTLKENLPGIETQLGSSYKIPYKDNTFDAVFIAQAFHWFSNIESLNEIHRVLKPEGGLGLIWNFEDLDNTHGNWQEQVVNLVWKYDLDVPQYRHNTWDKIFSDSNAAKLFKLPIHEKKFLWKTSVSRTHIWPYWKSRSYVTALPEIQKNKLRNQIEKIVDESVLNKDVDEVGDLIYHFGAHIVWTHAV